MRSAATSQFGNRFGISARRISAKSCIFLHLSAASDPMTERRPLRTRRQHRAPLDVVSSRCKADSFNDPWVVARDESGRRCNLKGTHEKGAAFRPKRLFRQVRLLATQLPLSREGSSQHSVSRPCLRSRASPRPADRNARRCGMWPDGAQGPPGCPPGSPPTGRARARPSEPSPAAGRARDPRMT